MRNTMLAIVALLFGTVVLAGPTPAAAAYDYPWCAMGGELGGPAIVPIEPVSNARHRSPGARDCIATSTSASCSGSSKGVSDRVPRNVEAGPHNMITTTNRISELHKVTRPARNNVSSTM
jgi:hypothetical protein